VASIGPSVPEVAIRRIASPNFLNLRLVCGPWTRMDLTNIWPPLPIAMMNRNEADLRAPKDYDFNVANAHHSRVCEMRLLLTSSQLHLVTSVMQEQQFPVLGHLELYFAGYDSCHRPALPNGGDGFLVGFSPRLRSLGLHSIPFSALPELLISTTNLVCLSLWNVPCYGYLSPEAIVNGLATLAYLKSLTIEFLSPLFRPGLEIPPPSPPTRTVLPALTNFEFKRPADTWRTSWPGSKPPCLTPYR
jgi:hypothetical protein